MDRGRPGGARVHNRSMPERRTRAIPLTGLRGFEAAARHLSFTLAARELHLTQSSISRQVKSLEDQVGRPLFRRGIRSLVLTPAGDRLFRTVQASLREIDERVAEVRGQTRRRQVSITTAPSLASLVLVPRLAEFSRAFPSIDLRIDASDEPRDLQADGLDLALRYFAHDRAPRGLPLLLDETVLPVMSPRLAQRIGPVRRPADLARATLLIEDGPADAEGAHWQRWFEAAGVAMPDDSPRLMLSFTHQALDAALREQGVMLAPEIYVREHLASGSLVAPLGRALPSGFGYYLIVNPASVRARHVAAFAQWLRDLFADTEATAPR